MEKDHPNGGPDAARPEAAPGDYPHHRSMQPVCVRLLLTRLTSGVRDIRHAFLYLAAGLVIISLLLAVAVSLPQMPYNVRELFGDRNLLLSLPLFAAFLVWVAGTPNVLARVTIICPLLHLLQPLLLLLLALPAWWMLTLSVSAESLIDVLGEPVLGWTGNWEPFVRFLGLSIPVLLFLFCWNLLMEGAAWLGWRFGIGQMVGALVLGVPLLWASKYIVIDLAATDRVIQLTAQGPSWMVGGAMIAAIGLVTTSGVLLAWTWIWGGRFRIATLVGVPVSLVLSWLMLNRGLNPDALQFLLGPGPGQTLSQLELFLRWTLLFAGMVGLITFSHLIPFRLRGTPASQRKAVTSGTLHQARKSGTA